MRDGEREKVTTESEESEQQQRKQVVGEGAGGEERDAQQASAKPRIHGIN